MSDNFQTPEKTHISNLSKFLKQIPLSETKNLPPGENGLWVFLFPGYFRPSANTRRNSPTIPKMEKKTPNIYRTLYNPVSGRIPKAPGTVINAPNTASDIKHNTICLLLIFSLFLCQIIFFNSNSNDADLTRVCADEMLF